MACQGRSTTIKVNGGKSTMNYYIFTLYRESYLPPKYSRYAIKSVLHIPKNHSKENVAGSS